MNQREYDRHIKGLFKKYIESEKAFKQLDKAHQKLCFENFRIGHRLGMETYKSFVLNEMPITQG